MEYTNGVTMQEWLLQAHPHPSPSTCANLSLPYDYQHAAIEEIHQQRIIDEMNKLEMLRVKNGESISFGVHADWSNDNEGKLDSDMSLEELLFGGD